MLRNKGFTLIELMVVIVIIGILAALALPKFLGSSSKAKASECKSVLAQMYTLETAYNQEKDTYSTDVTQIGFDQPTSNSRFTYSINSAAQSTFQCDAKVNGAGLIKAADGTDMNGNIVSISEPNIFWSTNQLLAGLVSAAKDKSGTSW